jgi:hypothetical protein
MNVPRIVIMDLAGGACPAKRCDQLDTLLHTAFPERHIHRVTSVPPGAISPAPDLLFLRPSHSQTLPQLVPRLRHEGTPAALIGLCCADRETPNYFVKSIGGSTMEK